MGKARVTEAILHLYRRQITQMNDYQMQRFAKNVVSSVSSTIVYIGYLADGEASRLTPSVFVLDDNSSSTPSQTRELPSSDSLSRRTLVIPVLPLPSHLSSHSDLKTQRSQSTTLRYQRLRSGLMSLTLLSLAIRMSVSRTPLLHATLRRAMY